MARNMEDYWVHFNSFFQSVNIKMGHESIALVIYFVFEIFEFFMMFYWLNGVTFLVNQWVRIENS